MRVLHVIHGLDPQSGGPPRVALEMATAQQSMGLVVSMMCWQPPGRREAVDRFVRDMHAENIPIHRLDPKGRLDAVFNTHSRGDVRRFIQQHDVIHLHGVWEPRMWWVARECRLQGKPYVIRPAGVFKPHAMQIKKWKKRMMLPLLYRRMVNKAELIHATAMDEARYLRCYGFTTPVAVIPNALNVDGLINTERGSSRVSVNQHWPELEGRRLVLFLARLHPIKGLDNLVKAWSAIGPKYPDWRLILAGPDTDGYQDKLKQALRAGHVLEQCVFTGMVEGQIKNALYAAADLFVLPSFTENFGMSIVESLAAGVPVITTKGTPWSELVEHRCGWWIDIGDQPLLSAMDEAMGGSSEHRAEMGQRGRALVHNRYSAAAASSHIRQMYAWVHGERSETPSFIFRDVIPSA